MLWQQLAKTLLEKDHPEEKDFQALAKKTVQILKEAGEKAGKEYRSTGHRKWGFIDKGQEATAINNAKRVTKEELEKAI